MPDLPQKISDVLSKHFKTDEKRVGSFTKEGLFSKTYNILTNQRFLIVRKGAIVSEQSFLFLENGEENIAIRKSDELLTTRRYITLQPDEKGIYEGGELIRQIGSEYYYLEPGEEYIAFSSDAKHWGGAIPPEFDHGYFDATFQILTNQALKSFSGRGKNFKQIDVLPLSDIVSVDLLKGGLFKISILKCCIALHLHSSDLPRYKTHFLSEQREYGESFPRKISEAAGVPFAPPFIQKKDKSKTLVELYTKADLKWPFKCANCLDATQELKYAPLNISVRKTATELRKDSLDLPKLVRYDVPYCKSCFRKKAVKDQQFNGVRATLIFANESYAEEFIRINS